MKSDMITQAKDLMDILVESWLLLRQSSDIAQGVDRETQEEQGAVTKV